MSYCRFSSDNWKSDVYVYENRDDRFVICVADNRVVGDVPPAPSGLPPEEHQLALQEQQAFLDTAKREPINGFYDGEIFAFDTAEDAAFRLEEIRAMGYHVPQYAIDALREELAGDDNEEHW